MGVFGFGGGVGVVDEPGGFVECVEGFGEGGDGAFFVGGLGEFLVGVGDGEAVGVGCVEFALVGELDEGVFWVEEVFEGFLDGAEGEAGVEA